MSLGIKKCKSVLVVVVMLVMACFALNYYLVTTGHMSSSANGVDGVVDALYFSTTTMSTIGYGDILPVTNTAKLAVAFQQMFMIGLGWGLLAVSCSDNSLAHVI